jgi:hypothetical protein
LNNWGWLPERPWSFTWIKALRCAEGGDLPDAKKGVSESRVDGLSVADAVSLYHRRKEVSPEKPIDRAKV